MLNPEISQASVLLSCKLLQLEVRDLGERREPDRLWTNLHACNRCCVSGNSAQEAAVLRVDIIGSRTQTCRIAMCNG